MEINVNNSDEKISNIQNILTVERPLVLLGLAPSASVLAGALALAWYYADKGISLEMVSIDGTAQILPFLERPVEIAQKIGKLEDFVLQFSTVRNDIADVVIERDDDMVRVVVTPEGGYIDPRDFSFAPSRAHYDMVICVGASDENWEQIYPEIAQAGALGGVRRQVIAPCTAFEMVPQAVAQMFVSAGLPPTSRVAHCLLAGLVVATDGLRSRAATADVFRLAARLMRYGGDLQEIMMRLYKDVTLEFLQLWGDLLVGLQLSSDKLCAISELSANQASATNLAIVAVLRRSANSLPNTQFFIALVPIPQTESQTESQVDKSKNEAMLEFRGIIFAQNVVDFAQILPKSSCYEIVALSDKSSKLFVTKLTTNELLTEIENNLRKK